MKWLPLLSYVLAAPTIAGSIMVAMLTMGVDNRLLIGGTLAGFIIAVPVAWMISRALRNAIRA